MKMIGFGKALQQLNELSVKVKLFSSLLALLNLYYNSRMSKELDT